MRPPGVGSRSGTTVDSSAVSAPLLPAATMATTTQLSLEDIARDAFRRKFFLDAFADERDALERSFAFLQRVREYKQLLGRRDVLQNVAEATVDEYLRDQAPHLCVFLPSPSTLELLERIFAAVDSKRSTLDLFCGMETHVNDRLEKAKYVAFLQTPQYPQLCDALRKHRELPLGEILVDARSTRFLEQFVRRSMNAPPLAVGNLLFWVQVQTVFLPLLQTNAVSVALFEEIQATVRRLYNTFLTETSPVLATAVPDTLRKDILKRILQLQGEPFSPARYATLFRQAQEKIWHWMQTYVYPKFQASMLYVALVVETENLESDRQLRKLSEHVYTSNAASTASPSKASAIFVPVELTGRKRPNYGDARYLRVVAPLQSEEKPSKWVRSLSLPEKLRADWGVRAVRVVDVVQVDEDGQVEYKHQLQVVSAEEEHGDQPSEDDRLDVMDFVWNWRHVVALPAVPSPSHRPHTAVPKPTFHSFSLPTTTSTLYGHVVTSWIHSVSAPERSFPVDPRAPEETAEHEDVDTNALPMLLPRFTFLLGSQRIPQQRIASGLRRLAEMPLDSLQPHDLSDLLVPREDPSNGHELSRPRRLTAAFSAFYLQPQLDHVNFHVHWIFRELSHQTVVALLASLLAGKSLVVVSPRPSVLVLVANALVELLRPLAWAHIFLPLCPVRTACALADRGFFASPSASSSPVPFIIGLEGELVHLKTKDSANEPRHRIRNSIYSVQRVNVQIRRPLLAHTHAVSCQHVDTAQYPTEILHTQAVVLDVDADDMYVPDRFDVPEFPQPLVRTLETTLKDAQLGGGLATEDSRLFRPPPSAPVFVERMLQDQDDDEASAPVATVDSVRLAVLLFLESLLGDVVFYFCSFRKSFAAADPGHAPDASVVMVDSTDTYILFEADAFLDAKIELGCRELFRQVFQTEMFRQFLVRQHRRFA